MKYAFSFLSLGVMIVFTHSAMASSPACVKLLSSAPYCMNVLSAEINCDRGETEVSHIKTCLDNYQIPNGFPKEKMKMLREIRSQACLVSISTDTSSPKNKSNCAE